MKTYIISLIILISGISFAQVTIGKSSPYTATNTTVSLEFGNAAGGARGIVLPWVTAAANVISAVPGTLIFDSNDQKVKFGTSATSDATTVASWTDLSAGAYTPATANIPDSNAENSSAKTLIGGNPATDTTPGILVLGDANKAMILPRVNSYTDIVNPTAEMIVYVTGTTPQQLAVYNGREWSFWTKP
ncbi:MAG: hypothetical protein DI529_11075 [Chryseobacterium sp.]|nr:MAG: hypothetical protein DI529_11075 [Chryseobacterium sp.]